MPTEEALKSKPKTPFGKFQILHGTHTEWGKTYKRGQIIESMSDLDRFNKPGARKFRRLDALPEPITDVPVNNKPTDTYDEMTIDELRAWAEGEEIDLGGATKKADIIKVLRQHDVG